MIVLDTSALTAIYRREHEGTLFQEVISEYDRVQVPAHVYVEFASLRRYGPTRVWLDLAIERYTMTVRALDSSIAHIAADAAERYGRGTGHRARLNFGDCLSYAVAKHLDAPLLYKGDDFTHTDIRSALAP